MKFLKSKKTIIAFIGVLLMLAPLFDTLRVALPSACHCSQTEEIKCCSGGSDLAFIPFISSEVKSVVSQDKGFESDFVRIPCFMKNSESISLGNLEAFIQNLQYKPPNLNYSTLSIELLQVFRI